MYSSAIILMKIDMEWMFLQSSDQEKPEKSLVWNLSTDHVEIEGGVLEVVIILAQCMVTRCWSVKEIFISQLPIYVCLSAAKQNSNINIGWI